MQRKQAHASTYAPQQQQKKGKEARTNKNAHLQLLRTLLSRDGLTHPPAQGRVLERKTAQAVAPNGALALALHAKLSRWHAAMRILGSFGGAFTDFNSLSSLNFVSVKRAGCSTSWSSGDVDRPLRPGRGSSLMLRVTLGRADGTALPEAAAMLAPPLSQANLVQVERVHKGSAQQPRSLETIFVFNESLSDHFIAFVFI